MNKETHTSSRIRPALLIVLFLVVAVLVWTNLAHRERELLYNAEFDSISRHRFGDGSVPSAPPGREPVDPSVAEDESSKWGRSIVWAQDSEALSELFDVIRSDPEIPELKRGSWPDQSESMLAYLRQIQGDVAIGPGGIPGFTGGEFPSGEELWLLGVKYMITSPQDTSPSTNGDSRDTKSPVYPNKMPKLHKNAIAAPPPVRPGWQLLRAENGYSVYLNPWSWPRAGCLNYRAKLDWTSLERDDFRVNDIETLTELLSGRYESPGRGTDFTVVHDEPGDILLDVTVLHPEFDGLLILNEPWDERWHATIDGSEVYINKLQGILMCIAVHPGKQTVEFKYSPG